MIFIKNACMKRDSVKIFQLKENKFRIEYPDGFSYECPASHLEFFEDISIDLREFEIQERPEANRASVVTRWGTYDPKKDKKNLFRMNIKDLIENPNMNKEMPVCIEALFGMNIPKNTGKAERLRMLSNEQKHIKRPDADNLQKFVFDTLKGVAFFDDSQIWDLHIRKRHADYPSTKVKIRYG